MVLAYERNIDNRLNHLSNQKSHKQLKILPFLSGKIKKRGQNNGINNVKFISRRYKTT